MNPDNAIIGVLALQGNYALHQAALTKLGIASKLVYKPSELSSLKGLIVPGGESTALLKLMTPLHWQDAIRDFKQQGNILFGTCAGMILFATSVVPEQESLGVIDVSVARNAYGRQINSHSAMGQCDKQIFGVDMFEMIFIRAPKIINAGEGVRVLATCSGSPVLVQQDNVLCASFHPELSEENFVHKYFVSLVN